MPDVVDSRIPTNETRSRPEKTVVKRRILWKDGACSTETTGGEACYYICTENEPRQTTGLSPRFRPLVLSSSILQFSVWPGSPPLVDWVLPYSTIRPPDMYRRFLCFYTRLVWQFHTPKCLENEWVYHRDSATFSFHSAVVLSLIVTLTEIDTWTQMCRRSRASGGLKEENWSPDPTRAIFTSPLVS